MDISEEELICLLSLSFSKGIGAITARQLLVQCGSAAEVFRLKKHRLERIPGVGPVRASAILKAQTRNLAERELKFIRKHQIRVLSLMESRYPRRLRQCDDAPIVLFFKGNGDLNAARIAALVGTRKVTDYGKQLTLELVKTMHECNATVISGLAYGVDITAHREAVRLGVPTIGVLAHGLDRIYPSVHRSVAEKMLEQGGLLTEYPSGTNPDRDNFPARNRIVAGMADATIVVESAVKGGALITAEFANSYNRDVFSVPGRADDPYSRGCNELIRTNKAMLVETGAQLVTDMNWSLSAPVPRQMPLFTDLSPDQSMVLKSIPTGGGRHLDEIAWECKLPVSRTAAILLELEFKGVVNALPGKLFRLS